MPKCQIQGSIHNRFDVYRKDILTGNEEQIGYGENIVLDAIYARLCALSTFFVNIHYGTGTGTLVPTRTSLFAHKGTKAATTTATQRALPTSYWQRSIILLPSEEVGTTITEVGIAYDSTASHLMTHSLLLDMNGNPLSITKKDTDQITIYSTIYSTFSSGNEHIQMCKASGNPLVLYLTGGSWSSVYFLTGRSNYPNHPTEQPYLFSDPVLKQLPSAASWITDVANKRIYTSTQRMETGDSNGHIREIGLTNLFRLVLPDPDIYPGLPINGVAVGTGDGLATNFNLPSLWVNPVGRKVYIDGVEATSGIAFSLKRGLNFISYYGYSAYTIFVASNGYGFAVDYSNKKLYRAIMTGYGVALTSINIPTATISDISQDGSTCCGLITSGSNYSHTAIRQINGVWTAVSLGIYQANGDRRSLCNNGDILTSYSGGNPGYCHFYVKKWNGTIWSDITNIAGNASVCCSGNGNILFYYSGSSIIVKDWNGTTFIERGVNIPVSFSANSVNKIYANDDGSYVGMCSDYSPYIQIYHWTGSTWELVMELPAIATKCAKICFNNNCTKLFISKYNAVSGNYNISIWELINNIWRELSNISIPLDSTASTNIDMENQLVGTAYGRIDMQESITSITFDSPPGLVTGEAVGTGDGATGEFILDYSPISAEALTVKLDGVATTAYTLSGSTITFTSGSEPANGVAITADYKRSCLITADYVVDGIHKTATRVIDMSAEITFGEVT